MMKLKSALLAAGAMLLVSGWASADLPGQHPYYLHALSDLRSARWMLQHRAGGAGVSANEDVAVTEINKAIGAIKNAAIDDGKNIDDHVNVDVPNDNRGRLHKALELLNKVHSDVAREEDDPVTRQLRDRAVAHIDAARDATKGALAAAAAGQ
jgi:hypothetical protein